MRIICIAAVFCSVFLSQCFGKNVFAKTGASSSGDSTDGPTSPRPTSPRPTPNQRNRGGCRDCGGSGESDDDSGNADCDRSGSGSGNDDYSLGRLIRDVCGPPPPRPPPGQRPPPLSRDEILEATTDASDTIMAMGTTLLSYRPEIEMALHSAQTDDLAQLLSHKVLFEGFQGLLESVGENICTIVPLHRVAEKIVNRRLALMDVAPAMILGFPDGGCARTQILLEECRKDFQDLSMDQIANELRGNITIVQVLATTILRDLRCLLDDTATFQVDLRDLVAEISGPGATLNHVRARVLALDTTVNFFVNQAIDMYFALEKVSGAIMLLDSSARHRERLAEKLVGLLEVLSDS